MRSSLLLWIVLFGWIVSLLPAAERANSPAPAGEKSATQAREIESFKDLQYAKIGDQSLMLDLYKPGKPAQSKLPVIVWIHGGAWKEGSKANCTPVKLGFVQKGYAVASVEYRFIDKAPFPAQIEDCKAAVRWLRAHADQYNLDSNRFAAWGESAGGHLVALLGTASDIKEFDKGDNLKYSSAVQAVCDYYGPTCFTGPDSLASEKDDLKPDSILSRLLGGPFGEKQDMAVKVSPVTYVSKGDAPTLILHGTSDNMVPLRQSILFHELLQKAGVDSVYHPIEGAGHGGPEFSSPQAVSMIDDFFQKHFRNVRN